MKMNDRRPWAILEEVRNLAFRQSDKHQIQEMERKAGIEQRYKMLFEALKVAHSDDGSLAHVAKAIAELGVEFQAGKTYPYLGGEPFDYDLK